MAIPRNYFGGSVLAVAVATAVSVNNQPSSYTQTEENGTPKEMLPTACNRILKTGQPITYFFELDKAFNGRTWRFLK